MIAEGAQVHFIGKFADLDPLIEIGEFAEVCVPLDFAMQGKADAAHTVAYCHSMGADCLIVDHYHADEPYQRVLLDAGIPWLQFDGTAAVPLWADWVVAMSPGADSVRYRNLQRRPETRLLLGPRYAILRDEFLKWREPHAIRRQANRLLLTFGGGDDRGACLACLYALTKTSAFDVTILTSSYNPQVAAIRSWIGQNSGSRTRLLLDDGDIARRMTEADIAITSGGTTTFELAMLGLPALIVQIAENQSTNAHGWDKAGVAVNLGPLDQLDIDCLIDELTKLAGDHERRERFATLGKALVDGNGADRIVRELYSDSVALL